MDQLVITGGGAGLNTYAIWQSVAVAPALNDVTRYTVTFKIEVTTPGDYRLTYRLASRSGSDGFAVFLDGKQVDRLKAPATGDWQAYETLNGSTTSLTAGEHLVTFEALGNEWNFNWFELTR